MSTTKNAFYNLAASGITLSLQALATLYVVKLGSLDDAGHFTLAYAIISPIFLFSGMGFTNLIVSEDPQYQDAKALVNSTQILYLPLFLFICVAIFAFAEPGLQLAVVLIGISRQIDLAAEIFQARNRVCEQYESLLYSAIAGAFSFFLFIIIGTSEGWEPLVVACFASLISSAATICVDFRFLSRMTNWSRGSLSKYELLSTISNNWHRGIASFINSVSANVPRYILHVFVSSASQAAYSIVVSFARAGMVVLQSLMWPRFRLFRTLLIENPAANTRLVVGVNAIFALAIAVAFMISMAAAIIIMRADIAFPDLFKQIPEGGYLIISGLILILFFRFSFWSLASFSLSTSNQVFIASINCISVLLLCILLVPSFGFKGAVVAESFAHAGLIFLVYWLIATRGIHRHVRGKMDVAITTINVLKKTEFPELMANKYNAVASAVLPAGFEAPKAIATTNGIKIELKQISVPLRDLFIDHCRGKNQEIAERLFRDAGVALAKIHSLPTGEAEDWWVSPFLRRRLSRLNSPHAPDAPHFSADDNVFIHGDYSYTNLYACSSGDTIRLCIIDPCPNGGSTFGICERGPRYLDLGMLVSCLWGQLPLGSLLAFRRSSAEKLISIFLEGYSDACGVFIQRDLLYIYAEAVAAAQFEFRFGIAGSFRSRFLTFLSGYKSDRYLYEQ